MSLHIIKPGLLDTIQDSGRMGFQHLGINPSGAMDVVGMQVANFLVGNSADTAVLEMHFPAPKLRLECPALIALSGADFNARANTNAIALNKPVLLRTGTELTFPQIKSGTRCYLAVRGGFDLEPWLGSCSTNLKAGAGGWKGRALQTGDVLPLQNHSDFSALLKDKNQRVFPWQADTSNFYPTKQPIRFCKGAEYEWLDVKSKKIFEKTDWQVMPQSDRMAYQAEGPVLRPKKQIELVSAATVPGTIQLLPSGRFMILMADSQTTGGYPRIAHIIRADLPRLAQLQAGQHFQLQQVDLETAVLALHQEQQTLRYLKLGCQLYLQRLMAKETG